MTSTQELEAAVDAAKAELKRLAGETRRARVRLDDALAALTEARGPKLSAEQRAAAREQAKAGKKVEKMVADARERALTAGKDPEAAVRFTKALLAAGFVQGKKRIFAKGSDLFRQLDDGRWIRKIPDREGFMPIEQTPKIGPEITVEVAMERLISGGFAHL